MALGEASWATFMGQVGHGLRLAMAQLAPSKKNTNRKKKQLRPKKKYCLFPISDRPYQNMCDPNLFYGFPKKKKNFFFFF